MPTNNPSTARRTASEQAARPDRLPPSDTIAGDVGAGAERHRLTDYPALTALRLTDHDLVQLCRQGFVCQENRGSLEYFKLRFRRECQQVVRYIADAAQAEAIRTELARLQADRRLELEMGRLTKTARRMLRDSKNQLESIVKTEGWKFHGLALRRSRMRESRL